MVNGPTHPEAQEAQPKLGRAPDAYGRAEE